MASVSGDEVTLDAGLAQQRKLGQADPDVKLTSYEFKLTVSKTGSPVEPPYDLLSLDPRHSRYYKRIVDSKLVDVLPATVAPTTSKPPGNLPAAMTAQFLQNGAADDPTALTAPGYQLGLDVLRPVDDVNLIVVPDLTTPSFQMKIVEHCEELGDRFAILDTPANLQPMGAGQRARTPAVAVLRARIRRRLLPVDLDHRSAEPARRRQARSAVRSPRRRVRALATPRASTTRRPTSRSCGASTSADGAFDTRDQRRSSTSRASTSSACSPGRPGRWCGARARTRQGRTAVALRQRPAAVHLRRGVDPARASAGRCSSPTTSALWKRLERTIGEFLTRVWAIGRAVRRDRQGGVLRRDRRGAEPAVGARAGAGHHRDRHARRSGRPSS